MSDTVIKIKNAYGKECGKAPNLNNDHNNVGYFQTSKGQWVFEFDAATKKAYISVGGAGWDYKCEVDEHGIQGGFENAPFTVIVWVMACYAEMTGSKIRSGSLINEMMRCEKMGY